MSAEYFIDTNVFVYHIEAADSRRSSIAGGIIERAVRDGSGCISSQVIQETLNVALRKSQVVLSRHSSRAYLDSVLAPLLRTFPGIELYHRALALQDRYCFAFYDSLIVAAALEAGCRRLYSEDLRHGQRIEGLTIENPFVE